MSRSRGNFAVFGICCCVVLLGIFTYLAAMDDNVKPTVAVTLNSTGGITQAEVDSLQVGDLLMRNDGLIMAVAHVKEDGSIHYWGKAVSLAGDYTCPRSHITTGFTEVYKLHTVQWKWAAEKFIIGQSQ